MLARDTEEPLVHLEAVGWAPTLENDWILLPPWLSFRVMIEVKIAVLCVKH